MKDDTVIFCSNLKSLRESLGLSQKEMAQRLEVSQPCLETMEGGILPPEVDVGILFLIYDQFGIPPSRMFEEHAKRSTQH